jgi:hypothetical protein
VPRYRLGALYDINSALSSLAIGPKKEARPIHQPLSFSVFPYVDPEPNLGRTAYASWNGFLLFLYIKERYSSIGTPPLNVATHEEKSRCCGYSGHCPPRSYIASDHFV